MPEEIELTPAQQELMNFLDLLATEPLSNEMLAQGYKLLDSAADECRQQQHAIAQQQQQQGGQS